MSVVSLPRATTMPSAPLDSRPCNGSFTAIRGTAAIDAPIRNRAPVERRAPSAFHSNRPGFRDNLFARLPMQHPSVRLSERQLSLLTHDVTQWKPQLSFVGQTEELDEGVEAMEIRVGDPQGLFKMVRRVRSNISSLIAGLREQHAELRASGVCRGMPIGKHRISRLHAVARCALSSRKQPTLHRDQLRRLGTAGTVRNGSQRRLTLHVASNDDVGVRVLVGDELVAEQSIFHDRHQLQRSTMRVLGSGCIEVAADERKKVCGFGKTRRNRGF